jgi:outer membrane protein
MLTRIAVSSAPVFLSLILSLSVSVPAALGLPAASAAQQAAAGAGQDPLGSAQDSLNPAQDSLTLDDCIAIAIQNSPVLAQQATSLKKSNAGVTSARSSYYPSADFSSSYRNSEGFGGDRQGSYSSSIGLGYDIYDGGNRRAGVDAARAKVGVAKEQYRLSEDQLVLRVKEAFFQILQKQEQISLVEDVAKRRKEDLVLIRLKYESGRESFPAVKEAEAGLFQAQYDIERAQYELSLAKVELNLLLVRHARGELSLKYEEKAISFPAVGTLVAAAKQNRPELLSEKANKPALQAQVTQAKSEYLPKVSFSTSYGLQGDELASQTTSWGAGVSLSLPIFDGFARKAKVTEATLSLQNQTDAIRELELQVEEEVEQAYSTWELARDIVQVTEKTLEAAREIYQLTKMQYEQGLTSYFFLQQKEAGLTQAETSRLSALLNVRVSGARLERVVGRTS